MPLTINISPVIIQTGFIQITYYSLVYILAFIAILIVLFKASKNKKINLSEYQIYNYIILLIISTLIGARVFHILFWDYTYFSQNLIEIFYIWNGGLSFHGGLLGAIFVSHIYCKKNKIGFLKMADLLIIPILLFLSLGRISNLINSEILGKITASNICLNFENVLGCRYPIQIYSTIGRFALFIFLVKIKSKKHKEGFIFYLFLFFISLGRFFLDFIREDPSYFYLSIGQWLSFILCLYSIYILKINYISIK